MSMSMSIRTITPAELRELAKKDGTVELIDVRTPAEFTEVHIPFARNIPLDRLDPRTIADSRHFPDSPLYVVCRSGSRGRQACERLFASGITNIVNVEGGRSRGGRPACRSSAVEKSCRLNVKSASPQAHSFSLV